MKDTYVHAYQYGFNTCNHPYNCPYQKDSILQELYDYGRVAGQETEIRKLNTVEKIMKRRNECDKKF
jgi:hypothetical protein